MNLKKVWKIFEALLLAMVIVAFLPGWIFPSLWPLWLALTIGFGAAALFVVAKFWRCPNCGKGLGLKPPKYCPNCGHKLDDLADDDLI